MNKPVLFCYDGSEGSRTALRAAIEWIKPAADAVVLTVWTPATMQLARAGSFVVAIPNEGEVDEQEAESPNGSPRRAPREPGPAATTRSRESPNRTSRSPRRSLTSQTRSTPA